MKTPTYAAITALAALIIAAPSVSTFESQAAGFKLPANKVVKPRIRVKPKIRVRVNTKRMLRKKNESETRTAKRTYAPRNAVPTQTLAVINPNDHKFDPAFESAIIELGEKLAHIDLSDIDVSDIAELDVTAAKLAFPVRELNDDTSNSSTPDGGLKWPGNDQGMRDPNGILPDQSDTPDTSMFEVSVEDVGNSVTSNAHGTLVTRTSRVIGNGWTQDESLYFESEGHYRRVINNYYANDTSNTIRTLETADGEVLQRETTDYDASMRVTRHTCVGQECDKPDMTIKETETAELRNPDAPGDAVIPVNCGSLHCNEARKGKGLDPTTQPGTHVLTTDPSDPQTSTVGDAPRTDRYWRDVATTNPGSEPVDNGDNGPVKTSQSHVLVLDEADGDIPMPGGR